MPFNALSVPMLWLLFQISTCTLAPRPTSWEKTRHSRALSGLPLTRTTSAQTSLKITGSMVHMHKYSTVLSHAVFKPFWKRVPLCPPDGYGHSRGGKTAHIHFAGTFIRMPSPNRGHTYWGIHSVSQSSWSQSHSCITTPLPPQTRTHTDEECVLPVCIHLESPMFYSHWRVVMYQQLSPGSKSLHMVSTFHNRAVYDVWTNSLHVSHQRAFQAA